MEEPVKKSIEGESQSNEKLWLDLWARIGAKGNAQEIYNDLKERYSEPHRAYHTLEHIRHCLDELKQVRDLAIHSDAIELALWYHDTVYDTKNKNSEKRSAQLVKDMIKNASLPDNFGELVLNFIMATKHSVVPTDPDTQLLVDIDLSILGQTDEKFDEYEKQIRKEYEWVSEEAFIAGRSKILQSFLSRPSIYSTDFFHDKYEERARRNISRSLSRLLG